MKHILATVLLLVLTLWACVPVPERKAVVVPEPGPAPPPLIQAHELDKMIESLQAILDKELSPQDRELARNLIRTYDSLKEVSSGPAEGRKYRGLIRSLCDDLWQLQRRYFSEKPSALQDYPEAVAVLVQKRREILEAYLAGSPKTVIDRCLELERVLGPEALTPDMALFFALSLGEEGMLEEAVNIGQGIVRELAPNPDLLLLRIKLAEWQLALGKKDEARRAYERLTDILDEKRAQVKSLAAGIGALPEREEPKGEDQEPEPDERPQGWRQRMKILIGTDRFQEARDFLRVKRDAAQTPEEKEALNQALAEIESAEEDYLKRRLATLARPEDPLASIRKLIEKEEYEEALSRLETLESGPNEPGPEVEALRIRATEALINRERNRAARLFLMAKETQDPTEKEAYLQSSYDILNSLIEKYRSSPLNKKIKSNIESVKKALDTLGAGTR